MNSLQVCQAIVYPLTVTLSDSGSVLDEQEYTYLDENQLPNTKSSLSQVLCRANLNTLFCIASINLYYYNKASNYRIMSNNSYRNYFLLYELRKLPNLPGNR